MKCPYLHQMHTTGTAPLCLGSIVSFEPSEMDMEYCATDRHRWCPLYRNAGRDRALAAQQEAACAIG